MKRGFLLFALVLLTGWIAGAQALGVGEIELNSHLNQRLSAEIPLVEAGELGVDEVLVSLGSPEDFERAGVERFFYLTDLRFEVFTDARGPRIRLTSKQPVTEPYLNFIVEVLWPKGRMLKEFTLLLDPPTYQAGISPPSSPSPDQEARSVATPPERTSPAAPQSATTSSPERGSPRSSTPSSSSPSEIPGEGVPTTGQTLWSIAARYLPASDIQLNQYMLAIQQGNPDAFIDNNINLMKAGYRLQMPDADAARQTSTTDAAAQVAGQTAAWRNKEPTPPSDEPEAVPTDVASATESKPAETPAAADPTLSAQIDATRSNASSEAAPAGSDGATGRLEIVADNAASGTSESPAANVGEAALKEENDRLEREVQELGYQSDREKELASSQIAVKDRQLEVKDQQLAELRSQLDEVQRKLAEQSGQKSPDQSQPVTPWWQSTTMMIGGGLLLVLALIAALLLARRRQQIAQDAAFREAIDETEARDIRAAPSRPASKADVVTGAAAVGVAPTLPGTDREAFDLLDDHPDERTGTPTLLSHHDVDAGPAPSPARQTGDVIGEADIYAAYGRYPHAIGLLLSALEEDADRHDVRLKLLEVAVSASDTETFDRHMRELVNRCDDQDILLAARELEESFVGVPTEREYQQDDDRSTATAMSDEGELAVDGLLDDSEEFNLEIDDDDLVKTEPEHSKLSFEPLYRPAIGATESDREASGDDLPESSDSLAGSGDTIDDDYAVIASDDTISSRADVLGGDLGIDFEADELPSSASFANSSDNKSSPVELEDDLDIDELLSDLDDSPEIQQALSESIVDRPSTPEDFQFTRVDDDVPLLDAADALGNDDAVEDDEGIEDLDDLLASLDEVEDVTSASANSEPRSAEILSFTRPKPGSSEASTRAFESDLESDAAESDDGFDFGDAEDAAETKLDLAQAYMEMGDAEGAQDILTEVLGEGNPAQRELARSLLDSLAS